MIGEALSLGVNGTYVIMFDILLQVMKEELKVAEERSKDIAGLRRRQQMMAGLPHLFNQLRLIFQSSNKSVFPYKELLSKVVSSNTELTDRSEVEERLKMLMELAPEWISAKKSLTGDMLYRLVFSHCCIFSDSPGLLCLGLV